MRKIEQLKDRQEARKRVKANDGRRIIMQDGYGLIRVQERTIAVPGGSSIVMPGHEEIRGMKKEDAARAYAERNVAMVVDPGPGWYNEITREREPSPFAVGDSVKLGPGKLGATFKNDPDWPGDLYVFAYADVVCVLREEG